jgi:hypothetical protein
MACIIPMCERSWPTPAARLDVDEAVGGVGHAIAEHARAVGVREVAHRVEVHNLQDEAR